MLHCLWSLLVVQSLNLPFPHWTNLNCRIFNFSVSVLKLTSVAQGRISMLVEMFVLIYWNNLLKLRGVLGQLNLPLVATTSHPTFSGGIPHLLLQFSYTTRWDWYRWEMSSGEQENFSSCWAPRVLPVQHCYPLLAFITAGELNTK